MFDLLAELWNGALLVAGVAVAVGFFVFFPFYGAYESAAKRGNWQQSAKVVSLAVLCAAAFISFAPHCAGEALDLEKSWRAFYRMTVVMGVAAGAGVWRGHRKGQKLNSVDPADPQSWTRK